MQTLKEIVTAQLSLTWSYLESVLVIQSVNIWALTMYQDCAALERQQWTRQTEIPMLMELGFMELMRGIISATWSPDPIPLLSFTIGFSETFWPRDGWWIGPCSFKELNVPDSNQLIRFEQEDRDASLYSRINIWGNLLFYFAHIECNGVQWKTRRQRSMMPKKIQGFLRVVT